MTHKGKFRRSDLQQLLEEAQHVLAFALPPVLWSYTPREFNRCADYLAGVARDHVKEHFTQSSQALCGLLPFASVPTLTLPEIPSLPMKFSSPLFRFYRQSPIRSSVTYGLPTPYAPLLSTASPCITARQLRITLVACIPHT